MTVNEGEVATNTGTFDDAFDVDHGESVTITASSGTVRTSGSELGTWYWESPTEDIAAYHPAGEYNETVKVTATDSTGRSSSIAFEMTVKPVVPIVTLTSPEHGSFVNGATTLSAEAQDNVAVSHVNFFVSGEYIGHDFDAPYEIPWDTAALTDGPVEVYAEARDRMGNVSTKSTRSVTVDNAAPEIPRLLSPTQDARTAAAFSTTGYAEPGTTVELFDGAISLGKTVASKFSQFSIPLSGLSGGEHSLYVVSTDRAGNVSAASEPLRIVVDTTKPKITGVAPLGGATGVAATTNVVVGFSEAMSTRTINPTTVVLVRRGSTLPLPATVTYNTARKKVILNPDRRLVQGAKYIATIKGGPSGMKDLVDNTLDRSKTWSFRTR